MAYEMLEPCDDDLRFGVVLANVATIAGVKKRDGTPWAPADFFGRLGEGKRKQGWRAAKARLAAYFGMSNEAVKAGARVPRPRRSK